MLVPQGRQAFFLSQNGNSLWWAGPGGWPAGTRPQRHDSVPDLNWLAPNFWAEGWEPGVDPQNFLAKVIAGSGGLHVEPIMFARNASCSEPANYNEPAILPGWQEMGATASSSTAAR